MRENSRKPRKTRRHFRVRRPGVRRIDTEMVLRQDRNNPTREYPGPLTEIDLKTGASNPNWRTQVENRVDATNAYSRTVCPSEIINPPVSWAWNSMRINEYPYPPGPASVCTLSGYPLMQSLGVWVRECGFSVVSDRMRSECKLAFLAKVREITSPFAGGVFLGELGKTARMIRGAAGQIFKSASLYRKQARRLKRRSRSNPDRLRRDLGDLYLGWTYGVAPLFGDVKSYLTSMQELFDVPKVTPVIVTIQGEPEISMRSTAYSTFGNLIRVGGVESRVNRASTRIIGAVLGQLEGPSLQKARELNGFRLADFLPTAYELLPYSFLVDYFTSLGDVVNGAFTATRDLVYAVRVEKQTVKGLGVYFGLPGAAAFYKPTSWPLIPTRRVIGKFALNRTKADLGVSLSDLHFKLPDLKQAFNALVLGTQRMRLGDKT